MSTSYFYTHRKDKNLTNKLRTFLSQSYSKGPTILTRNKLYSIIYMGLLLTNDSFQLADILRFCREGHLSFLSYNHFFPEEFNEKQVDADIFQVGKKNIPTHLNIREMVYQIQNIMKLNIIQKWNICPDLKKLCERYCIELNLPGVYIENC